MTASPTRSTLIDLQSLSHLSQTYKELLDRDLFFEAHETLESLWFPLRFEKDEEITLIRAYINAAVSFELLKRGRHASALKPWVFFQKQRHLLTAVTKAHKTHYKALDNHIIETQKRLLGFKN